MQIKSLFFALSAATVAIAGSPVESGPWTSVNPKYSEQQCAGGKVSGNTFSIPKTATGGGGSGCGNGHMRAERRYNNDYSSGTHQFGGTFKINSMTGDRISIKQTFNGDSGPFFIMGVEKSGRLYNVEGGATIADGVAKVGASVRINTVHNAGNKGYRVYVNGKQVYSTTSPGGSFYDKIGAYNTNSGSGALSITWDDVQFWTK